MALPLPGANISQRAHQRQPGWGAWLLLAPLALWLVMFVVVPTVLLIVMSFCQKDPGSLGRIAFSFTLDNFQRAFQPTYLRILGTSLWYAFLTTVICLLMGFPVAFFIGRAPERVRNILLLLVMIPFWTSFLIRTYAWISILSNQGFLNAFLKSTGLVSEPLSLMYTPFAVVLGLVYNFLPFMILPIFGSVEKLDQSLIEAAYDLGARPLRAFSDVIIPLTKPGIIAGCFLVFVPAIAMFAITTLMGGGSNPTIGEVIQKQFGAAQNQPFGAALGTLLLVIFFAGLFATRRRSTE